MNPAPTAERPRLIRVPGGHIPVGQYAGTGEPHHFQPDRHVGTSCLACYGWLDDPRHTIEGNTP